MTQHLELLEAEIRTLQEALAHETRRMKEQEIERESLRRALEEIRARRYRLSFSIGVSQADDKASVLWEMLSHHIEPQTPPLNPTDTEWTPRTTEWFNFIGFEPTPPPSPQDPSSS